MGTTYGYQHPRRYIIPARLVKKGLAQIAVYNLDFSAGAGIWGEPREMTLSLVGSTETISLAGEWKVNTALPLSQMNPMPKNTAYNQNAPSVLFNSMISPLIPYAIRGAIWYQGEANAPRAYQYRELLPIMVNDWRARWQKPFPFYIMQLANYKARNAEPVESDWAELREAQQMAADHLVACETAVNIDIGMANDIHPISKDIVGDRLARLASRSITNIICLTADRVTNLTSSVRSPLPLPFSLPMHFKLPTDSLCEALPSLVPTAAFTMLMQLLRETPSKYPRHTFPPRWLCVMPGPTIPIATSSTHISCPPHLSAPTIGRASPSTIIDAALSNEQQTIGSTSAPRLVNS